MKRLRWHGSLSAQREADAAFAKLKTKKRLKKSNSPGPSTKWGKRKCVKAKVKLGRVEYDSYIRSEAWRRKRQLAMQRDGFQCVRCKSGKNLTVHHKTYDRLGKEKLRDLETLCRTCHNDTHLAEVLGVSVESLDEMPWRV